MACDPKDYMTFDLIGRDAPSEKVTLFLGYCEKCLCEEPKVTICVNTNRHLCFVRLCVDCIIEMKEKMLEPTCGTPKPAKKILRA